MLRSFNPGTRRPSAHAVLKLKYPRPAISLNNCSSLIWMPQTRNQPSNRAPMNSRISDHVIGVTTSGNTSPALAFVHTCRSSKLVSRPGCDVVTARACNSQISPPRTPHSMSNGPPSNRSASSPSPANRADVSSSSTGALDFPAGSNSSRTPFSSATICTGFSPASRRTTRSRERDTFTRSGATLP